MSVFSDTSPIIIKKRKGNSEEPFKPIQERILVLENGFGVLYEIPDKFTKVIINGMVERDTDFSDSNVIKNENEYVVDYNRGFIYFHQSKVKQQITVKYKGIGVVLYPASRIYDTGNTNVITTIQEMIDGGRKSIESYNNIDNAIRIGKETYITLSNTINQAKNTNSDLQKVIQNIISINKTMKNEHTSRTTEYNNLKKIILDENSSATLLQKNVDTNKRIDENVNSIKNNITQQNTNINRIDSLNKSIKIAIENPITVERNSIGLNPLNSLNYVGGDTFQANVPITINSGNVGFNYNSEFELVNNNNVRYVPAKDKTIENSDSIKSLLEKINKLEEKVKSLKTVDKK